MSLVMIRGEDSTDDCNVWQTLSQNRRLCNQKSALSGKAHLEMSDSSSAKWCRGWVLRHLCVLLYSSMFPVWERATPSKEVMAAPRRRVSARKTERFSSATSARSSWSTISSLSLIEDSVNS